MVFSLLSGAVSPAAASGAAAGALLVWYKATECIFPPAAVVCVLMAGQARHRLDNIHAPEGCLPL